MKHIKLNVTPAEEANILKGACKTPELLALQPSWITAYTGYTNNQGNPWLVSPMGVPPQEHGQLYRLYDTRKGTKALRSIRGTTGLLCCPMCGATGTGNLDHYLPRGEYPEFSIMRANLLPACSHCNSESKKTQVKGTVNPQRFIHPYFDTWADNPIWIVRFTPPFAAVRFSAEPYAGLTTDQTAIVAFHLQNVLGDQFHRSMANMFSTLPQGLKVQLAKTTLSVAAVEKQLEVNMDFAVATNGMNSWEAAFYDGLREDPGAVAFMHYGVASLP